MRFHVTTPTNNVAFSFAGSTTSTTSPRRRWIGDCLDHSFGSSHPSGGGGTSTAAASFKVIGKREWLLFSPLLLLMMMMVHEEGLDQVRC